MRKLHLILLLAIATMFTACKGGRANDTLRDNSTMTTVTYFDTDTAMSYLKAQTLMGPRVPGTDSHSRCASWLAETLRGVGADTVMVQDTEALTWNGDNIPLHNIRARFGTKNGVAPVLLLAHWDSRPWADADDNPSFHTQPIDGANDGASGVAVLLEIARQAGIRGTRMPIEILLVDGEDYGSHDDHGDETSWCLGTQEWLKSEPYAGTNAPRYAILLDMVGGRDARFNREYISDTYASQIVDMVWNEAARIGLGDRFVNSRGGAVVDDHLFLNRAGIPAIDIIESINPATGSFNPTWHTINDTYENIDPAAIADTGRLISHLTIQQ